jgi:hypothetical protein
MELIKDYETKGRLLVHAVERRDVAEKELRSMTIQFQKDKENLAYTQDQLKFAADSEDSLRKEYNELTEKLYKYLEAIPEVKVKHE